MFDMKIFWGLTVRTGVLTTLFTFFLVGVVMLGVKLFYEGVPKTFLDITWILLNLIMLNIFPALGIIGVCLRWRHLLIPFMGSLLLEISIFIFLTVDLFLSYMQHPLILHELKKNFNSWSTASGVAVLVLVEFLFLSLIAMMIYDFYGMLCYFKILGRKRETRATKSSSISSTSSKSPY